jgi:8-oxo-dGTP diphosphatase
MTEKVDIHKAGAVLLDGQGNFLVTRTAGKDIFVAPGGKLEAGESVLKALAREMMEEVQVEVNTDTAEHLGTFRAFAAGNESKVVEMDVYLIKDSTGVPVASSEIEEIMWVNSKTQGVPIGSIFEHDVMPLLKERELID